jgi:hypothetical protein
MTIVVKISQGFIPSHSAAGESGNSSDEVLSRKSAGRLSIRFPTKCFFLDEKWKVGWRDAKLFGLSTVYILGHRASIASAIETR